MAMIDRDKLIQELKAYRDDGKGITDIYGAEWLPAMRCAIRDCIDIVKEMPEQDKTATWVPNIRSDKIVVCTNCLFGMPADSYAWLDCNRRNDERQSAVILSEWACYCPRCGAKMKGVLNEAD